MSLAENFRRDDEIAKRGSLQKDIDSIASQDSIVEGFAISGLYGYRSISMKSDYAATILIARNGSGKTTLLGALDAFLKCQFFRLADLDFFEIKCRLRGLLAEVVLTKKTLSAFVDLPPHCDFWREATKLNVEPTTFFRFLVEDYANLRGDYNSLSEIKVFDTILRQYSFRLSDAYAICDKLRILAFRTNPNIYEIHSIWKEY